MSKKYVYTLYGPKFKADPFPTYARMRQADPICYHPGIHGTNLIWFITRHADAEAVLRDHKRFVKNWRSTRTPAERAKLPPDPPLVRLLDNHMLNLDGDDHARLRALVNKAFTTRTVNSLEGRVQSIADELLDRVYARGQMDLIDEYAFPLPIIVICEMLGIPSEDRARFRTWSNAFLSPTLTAEEWQRTERLMVEFTEYLRGCFEARRQQPRDDLITALIQAEAEGDQLSEEELFSMVILLIVAGHETTVNLIGNGMLSLMRHPVQMELLKNDPSLIESAIEELLRYDGPVERATMRFAAADVKIGGHLIRRGETVAVVLSSANRDAVQHARADELDITRDSNRHLAFGMGVHYCLGAPLARMEGKIAINTLLRRLPGLRLTAPIDSLEWTLVPILRGVQHMPVAWDVPPHRHVPE
jgi:cytochrome P450